MIRYTAGTGPTRYCHPAGAVIVLSPMTGYFHMIVPRSGRQPYAKEPDGRVEAHVLVKTADGGFEISGPGVETALTCTWNLDETQRALKRALIDE